ncbi:pyridine nucleotide-disulfide oxidoreductase domain-containing protein 2-like [Frankliniella occidentalis]|uniref:Pyridine nucleotide-disulfide oxidoreductase domain-containing protein 2-like n=1 Tax=Frankliniella occidentalis TaxID=133901 RepID=A0A9C6XAD1_FRAOC|nr:pyridine nucleotide-disulfide oxidoreductase domain-containing protein 2-like [Frankliniella occidentalis]
MPHHQATIHLNCEDMSLLDEAYDCAKRGVISERPMIEMVLPSVLDRTLAPEGAHVCLLFTQFTPYNLPGGWSEHAKEAYASKVRVRPGIVVVAPFRYTEHHHSQGCQKSRQ